MDAELVRLCLEGIRTFCGSILSVTIAVGTASRLLGRRKSTVPIVCYYYAKQFFAGILLGQVFGFYCGKLAWYRLGYAVLISVLAIVTFWFNCYTFEGDLLKVAVGAWIGELVCVFILNFTFILVNFLEKRENVLALPALPEPADLLVFLIGFGMYGIFLRIFSPFLERFRNLRLQRRKLLWTLFGAYLLLANSTVFFGAQEDGEIWNAFLASFLCSASALFGLLLCGSYKKRLERENRSLAVQKHMADAHREALEDQMRNLEQRRAETDAWIKELEKQKTEGIQSKRVRRYLEAVCQEYEKLWAGNYWSGRAADAVLSVQGERMRKADIMFECALQGLPEGCLEEQELAEIFLLLLEWAVPEENDRRTPGGEMRVRLRGTAVKNWVILECASNVRGSDKMGDTERVLRHGMRKYLKKYEGSIKIAGEATGEKMILLSFLWRNMVY